MNRWRVSAFGALAILAALLPVPATAGIDEARNYHPFSGNLNSRWGFQTPLAATGFTAAYLADTITPGTTSSVLDLPALSPTQSLTLTNWAAVNNGAGVNGGGTATRTNRWALIMDIRPTTVAATTWTSLLQTNPANTDDAEIFIRNDGSMFAAGALAPAGTILFNQWQRLAFVCDNNGIGGSLTLTAYRNGVLIGSVGALEFDGRFSLSSQVLLFADNNSETTPCRVNALCFWTEPRSAAEIAAMAGPSAANPEIQWPSMPTPAARPGLSGRFRFGDFALDLPDSGFLLGNGTLTLSSAAIVPGHPSYSLNGNHAFRLSANGDLAYTGGTTFLTGSAAVRVVNVLINPGGVTLTSTGATASAYSVRLPVGLAVGRPPDPANPSRMPRRFRDTAQLGAKNLATGLIPSGGGQTLLPIHFGLEPGSMSVALESRPVRYVLPSITWAPSSGAFQLLSTANVQFDRTYERACLIAWNAIAGINGDPRPSNDDLHAFASDMETTIVDATPSGMAVIREGVQNIASSSTGYTTHFPRGVQIRWSAGGASRIRHLGSALQADSFLYEGLSSQIETARDSAESGCGILAGNKSFSFTPPDHWVLTRDGGLHAQVTLNGTAAQRSVEWGGIDASTFAHKIDTAFSSGSVLIAGTSLSASQVPGIPLADRPAALLLSGNGNGSLPETTVERPSSPAYLTGAADYPGLNLRITASGSHTATSRLAGTPLAYPLRNTSKYYLRPSGLTGVHDAVAAAVPPGQSYPINTVLAGYPVGLSDIRLSFLASHNLQSGINGAFNLPAPASLSNLAVQNLRFGPRGEFLDADFQAAGELTLGYWGCKITPHALSFAKPNTPCPLPSSTQLVLGASVKLPALSDQTFSGNIGFKPNGHTIVPADDVILANGEHVTSRLRPPNSLLIKGPGSLTYPFAPTGRGAWLNEFSGPAPPGFVAIPGELNVPFFRDLKVLLNAKSSAGATQDSTIDIHAGDHPSFNHFNDIDADLSNLGVVPGLPGPRARRTLWDLIDLDLPLTWNNSLRRFSGTPVEKELLLFRLDQTCSTLGPQIAEVNFGASASSIAKSISAATLMDALGADSKGLLAGITGPAATLLNEALASLKLTDDLSEAAYDKLLAPALEDASNAAANALFDALAARYTAVGFATFKANPDATNPDFLAAVSAVTGQFGALSNGQWRTGIRNRISDAITVCDRLDSLASNSSNILSIAQSIAQNTGSGAGNAPSIGNVAETLADLRSTLANLRARLIEIRDAFNPGATYTNLLAASLGTNASVQAWLSPALGPLKSDWVAKLDDPTGTGFFAQPARRATFVAQFKQRVRSGFLGSVTEQNIRQVITEVTGDPLARLRNSFDGIVATANTAAQSANPLPAPNITTLGSFSDVFSGAKLTGYARINGESLKELRLDGELNLKVPDDLAIKAWFVMRDMDGSLPGDATLAAGGVKTEITVGAATPLSFLGQDAYASAELRVGIGQSGPVAVAGSLDITGQIDFESIKVNHLHLAVAIGASDCYIGAKVAGELDTGVFIIGAEVAVFLGKTSRLDPVAKINPNVADLITKLGLGATDATSPLYGAYVYAYGDFSVLSLIGIPPTCLLDIRLGGGQGNFIFYREGAGALAGMQFTHAIRGRALCLVNVGGSIDGYIAGAYSTANGKNASFSNLKAAGRLNAVLSGKIGVSPLSYTWKKNFAFDVAIDPAASPKTSWSVNY
jgi:hypothetical protein